MLAAQTVAVSSNVHWSWITLLVGVIIGIALDRKIK